MLNPPLALLSDDLLVSIVEHVANLPSRDEDLHNLSLADRAFTQSCQKYIFWNLRFSSKGDISERVKKVKKILLDNPTFANQVRMVGFLLSPDEEYARLFNDHTLISIFQLLSESPMPPHELHFSGGKFGGYISSKMNSSFFMTLKNWTIPLMKPIAQSFFSKTLTILHLTACTNTPLPMLLICPRLRKVFLDNVGATTCTSYDEYEYPDYLFSGRVPPPLEVLDYRNSHSLVKQMITPPPRFNTPVVVWSNLRILTLSPHEKEGMACLQPILDAACNSLEELYLTSTDMGGFHLAQHLLLAGLLNLSNLPNLHVFSLCTNIACYAPLSPPPKAVLHDINLVLGAIPESNKVTNLRFDLTIVGWCPFLGCLEQDWVGMFNQVIRIADGKPLELELQIAVSTGILATGHPGQDELYIRIMEETAPLSDYPNICTHFWNPTFGARGLAPFPRGQVRSRCRR